MSLIQSTYWLASDMDEQGEILYDFLTKNTANSLVIILKTGTNDVACILNGLRDDSEFDCNIKLVTKSGTKNYGSTLNKPTKTIYVYANLNTEAITLMQTLQPLLAIFV